MAMLPRNMQNTSAKHSRVEELPCRSLDVDATMLESVLCPASCFDHDFTIRIVAGADETF
jgi:hypothetical protein